MKKTCAIKTLLLGLAFSMMILSCDTPDFPSSKAVEPGTNSSIEFTDYSSYNISTMDVQSDFMRGVDASEVQALEELGQKWYDSDNTEKDLFQILANHGVNWVRLRIWNDYTVALDDSWAPYGYNNLSRTIVMAKRAKEAGLKIFLDFHYSDNWADPAKQYIPEMWKGFVESESNGTALASSSIDIDGLSKAVADYTKDVIEAMKVEGCLPDMVQLGNEMQGGIFARTRTGVSSADGSDGNQTNLTLDHRYLILNAAKKAVKDIDSNILVALHCSDPQKYLTGFMSGYIANVKPDVVAISYYPYYSGHGTDVQLKGFIETITNAGYKAVVAEVSYSYNKDAYTDNTSNSFYTAQETQSAKQLTQYSGISDGAIVASIENQAGVVKYIAEIPKNSAEKTIYKELEEVYL